MSDNELAQRATALRRGVTRLSRRLRMERPEQVESATQVGTLALLNSNGPMTPGELAVAQRVQPQSLTRTLSALEAAELLVRQPDPHDGRRSLLTITAAGKEAVRHDMRQRDRWLASAMASQLTSTEQELLRLAGELMERLAEADVAAPHSPHTADTPDNVRG